MNPWIVIATLAAGGIGAGLRYVVDALVMRHRSGRFPVGILVVNLTGSLALGVVTAYATGTPLVTILGIGLLGGYTTFSTVSVETVLLAERRQRARALTNAVGTVLGCIAAAAVGLVIGGFLAG